MRIHFWNLFLSLFFVLLVVVGFAYLGSVGRIFYDISIRDLLLMALAIFRLVRLFSYDIITKFVRDWFVGAPKDSFKDTLGTLINCPWCTGLWFSFLVVFFYFATIYSWPVILILSLAALGSIFQVIGNWIGWSAEAKKLEVQKMRGE
ncbi:hypothetical protein BH11PAT2_BH11PAT2_06410 [soil metagenome]